MTDPLELTDTDPIATIEIDYSYQDTGVCPNCKYEGLEMTENCTGVEYFHFFNPLNKQWQKDESSTNWYGDTNCTYKCPKCNWNSENSLVCGGLK